MLTWLRNQIDSIWIVILSFWFPYTSIVRYVSNVFMMIWRILYAFSLFSFFLPWKMIHYDSNGICSSYLFNVSIFFSIEHWEFNITNKCLIEKHSQLHICEIFCNCMAFLFVCRYNGNKKNGGSRDSVIWCNDIMV